MRELNPLWEPSGSDIGFVKGAISAFESKFTTAFIKGCFLCAGQLSKILELGLVVEYREDKDLRKKTKSFFALALIPECDLKLALEAFYATTTEKDQLHSNLDYFETIWVG